MCVPCPCRVSSLAQSLDIDLNQLSKHKVCAVHLATFLQVARRAQEHWYRNFEFLYDENIIRTSSNAIVDDILSYLGVEEANLDSDVRDEVSSILALKSNASGDEGDERNWDATKENIDITVEVRDASNKFMLNVMDAIVRSRRTRM